MKISFLAKGGATQIMKDLFQLSLTKKLDFILTGASVSDCTREMVYEQPVEFRDNLMEGFVKFKVQVENKNNGLLFKIDMMGTNRDKYLEPRLKQTISSFGYEVVNA